MAGKRKRGDVLDVFDPNKSDSEDRDFQPEAAARSTGKASKKRQAKPTKHKTASNSRKRPKYGGSEIDDDDDDDDEDLVTSEIDANSDSEEEDEEESEVDVTAGGRRQRKAAAKATNYKESSEDDEEGDDDEPAEVAKPRGRKAKTETPAQQPRKPESRLVTLKYSKDAKVAASAPHPFATRRSTRRNSEEADATLYELSNSGKHATVVRASRSRSVSIEPTTQLRATRGGKGVKGIKHPPPPIEEATQETSQDQNPAEDSEPEAEAEKEGSAVVEHEGEEMMKPSAEESEDELAQETAAAADDEDEDDDDGPLTRRGRASKGSISGPAQLQEDAAADENAAETSAGRRLTRQAKMRKNLAEPSSDFEPGDEESAEEDMSTAGGGKKGKSKSQSKTPDDDPDEEYTSGSRRSRRPRPKAARNTRGKRKAGEDDDSADELLDENEIAEELMELRASSRQRRRRRSPSILFQEPKRRRVTKPVDYSIKPLDQLFPGDDEEEEPAAPTPARGRRGGRNGNNAGWERSLNTTYGPFGGGSNAGALLGGPWGTGAAGGVDSDSSDDEMVQRSGFGNNVGMTPTSAVAPGLIAPGGAVPPNVESIAGPLVAPNVGKIKSHKALADADPLGVDLSVDFSQVGGLQGHVDKLKEMVTLPLLYPELFIRFHVTPPRGVLFHGPPGTGKTLLARALSNSIGLGGRKITFYMRKGADALSKWVGEAEKQLRLLFEEARRTQPSIIFFDEIDGLAPVRSSKQEQIHASIVSTLLALMDGMDGRGQVIVIGATNRPDNIDPALRRPGRFDREFYFPLPDVEGRRSILDIHTKDWGLSGEFKDSLAKHTKGYGGADLRALCTEAALNSIQRTYPQIYSSKQKLIVDPDKLEVHAADFMLSIKQMVPSSERSASSSAAPLPASIEPLLRSQFAQVKQILDRILPRKKKATALEEAMFEPYNDLDQGFGREKMSQDFERARIFRPRLLITGPAGMGQAYIASAILHFFEGVHVQKFDLPTLVGDGRPIEQVIVGMFAEVKRHKPSVIFIPNIEDWEDIITGTAFTTFQAMLRSIPPTDPVLLLATTEVEPKDLPEWIGKGLFGLSSKNQTEIDRPTKESRAEYFSTVIAYLKKHPGEFPDPDNRKVRVLEELPEAPAPTPKPKSKAELKAEAKRDRQILNILKVQLQPIMDQINRRYKKFRQPVIPPSSYQYLFEERDPNYVSPDIMEPDKRPFEIVKDKDGTEGLRETATGKFFYNLETTTIEERLSNGFYARPKDFAKDIRALAKDAKNAGDKERTLKANELLANVEVDVANIEAQYGYIDWEALHQRQLDRAKENVEKERKRKAMQSILSRVQSDLAAESDNNGPVTTGEAIPRAPTATARFQVIESPLSNGHGMSNQTTNGTSVPSRPEGEDTAMGGTEGDVPAEGSAMRPPSQWPSTRATAGTTQVSQVSAVTSIPPGVSPSAVVNDASTTKTSDPSNRSSGGFSTQRTNGFHHDQFSPPDPPGGSQLPDTQPIINTQTSSSEENWPHSQAHGMARGLLRGPFGSDPSSRTGQTSPTSSQQLPGRGGGGMGLPNPFAAPTAPSRVTSTHALPTLSNMLNSPVPGSGGLAGATATATATAAGLGGVTANPSSSQAAARLSGTQESSQDRPSLTGRGALIRVDENDAREFLKDLTEQTSGCTIEQLEQINRDLMDEIWRTKHVWNRDKVLGILRSVFNESVRDIEEVQGMGPSSQKRKNRQNADGDAVGADDDLVEVQATQ